MNLWKSKCALVNPLFRCYFLRTIAIFPSSCTAAEEMDEADNELRDVVCKIWPNHAKKQIKLPEGGTKSLIDLALPPKHGRRSRFVFISSTLRSSQRTARNTRSAKVNRGQNLCHLHVRRQLPFVQTGSHQRYGKSDDGASPCPRSTASEV